jgi:uncharacterized membrane protein YqaE (UPF0057 family)
MVKASDILLCLVAILFPPAAAAFVAGCCSCDMLINVRGGDARAGGG